MSKPVIRVDVTDLETGKVTTRELAAGDYILIPTAPAYLASTQVRQGGSTHVITVKGQRSQLPTAAPAPDREDDDDLCCGMHGLICVVSDEPCCRRCPGEA